MRLIDADELVDEFRYTKDEEKVCQNFIQGKFISKF